MYGGRKTIDFDAKIEVYEKINRLRELTQEESDRLDYLYKRKANQKHSATYRAKHKEQRKKYDKKYGKRKRSRTMSAKRCREHYTKHRSTMLQRAKDYHEKHRDDILKKQRRKRLNARLKKQQEEFEACQTLAKISSKYLTWLVESSNPITHQRSLLISACLMVLISS